MVMMAVCKADPSSDACKSKIDEFLKYAARLDRAGIDVFPDQQPGDSTLNLDIDADTLAQFTAGKGFVYLDVILARYMADAVSNNTSIPDAIDGAMAQIARTNAGTAAILEMAGMVGVTGVCNVAALACRGLITAVILNGLNHGAGYAQTLITGKDADALLVSGLKQLNFSDATAQKIQTALDLGLIAATLVTSGGNALSIRFKVSDAADDSIKSIFNGLDIDAETGAASVPRAVPVGDSGFVKAATLERGTTVELTNDVVLTDGSRISQGSVVTWTENGYRITAPDGFVTKLVTQAVPGQPSNGSVLPIGDAAMEYGNIRSVAGYEVAGTAGLAGDTYNMNVWALYRTGDSEGLSKLLTTFIDEAKAAGASKISITGTNIINAGIASITPGQAARFGLTVEKINASTIMLTGPVR